MFDDDKALNLQNTYTYVVSVKDIDQHFAGKLILTPDKCTLKVMGERRPTFDFSQSSKIECSAFSKSFILFDLSISSQAFQNLQYINSAHVGFFEYEFEVGFVVCYEGYLDSSDDAISFCVESEMTKKWVGYTNLQQALVDKFHTRTLNPIFDSLEFEQILEGYGKLRLYYHFQTFNSIYQFSSGLNFPPKLSIHFASPIQLSNLHFEYKKFYHLMTLLIGSDFKVNEVKATTSRLNTNLYFPTSHQNHKHDYSVFPLSFNLKFNNQDLPHFPLKAFSNYYSLQEEERVFFTRYLRYQRMNSDEEKFLGFFRLLESLVTSSSCYVEPSSLASLLNSAQPYILKKLKGKGRSKDIKNLISRIGRLNTMKYNTTKCIEDFFTKLPDHFRDSIIITDKDIQSIVKLRNNITHANSYTVNDSELQTYTSFINALLYIALLEKVGVPVETSSKIIYRLDGYHHIQDLT